MKKNVTLKLEESVAKGGGKGNRNMKLVLRADDFGYTKTYNMGVLEAIEHGLVTHVDMMLDTPGSEDAMEKIRMYPWISVGWHSHYWGKPVADPHLIPSMVDEYGRFNFRNDYTLKKNVKYEEALIEMRAEIERCIRVMGKAPDTAWVKRGKVEEKDRTGKGSWNSPLGETPVDEARKQVCDEYGIAYDTGIKHERGGQVWPAAKKFEEAGLVMPLQFETMTKCLHSNDRNEWEKYSPRNYILNDVDHLLENKASIVAFHPGYCDPYIMKDIEDDNRLWFTMFAQRDIPFLCSRELREWIKKNDIELCNHRDVIYGTKDYQNHLKVIGSDLARDQLSLCNE